MGRRTQVVYTIEKNKALMVLGGAITVAGLIIALFPGLTVGVIAVISGVSLALAGGCTLVVWWKTRANLPGSTMVLAIVQIIAGLLFVFNPVFVGNAMMWLFVICLVVYGLTRIVQGKNERELGRNGWMLTTVTGVLAILAGIALLIWSNLFALVVGLFIAIMGISLLYTGYKPQNEPAPYGRPRRR